MERIKGIDVFEDLFVPANLSLLTMKESNDIIHYNNETSVKAESLIKLIDKFLFD